MADDGMPSWYRPPVHPVADELAEINALRTTYEDTGWLSTLVFNTRNSYLAFSQVTFSAAQVRMLVEGFLAELALRDGEAFYEGAAHMSHHRAEVD